MRGNTFLNRVGIAALAGAFMVTPALGWFGGLHNTGEYVTFPGWSDPNGPGSIDGHWMQSAPGGVDPYSNAYTYYHPNYAPSDSFFDTDTMNSNWIGTVPFAQGTWSYFKLTFDVADFAGLGLSNNWNTWGFSGIWSSDNKSELWFNGDKIGTHGTDAAIHDTYKTASTFTVNPGKFKLTGNELIIRVYNDPVTHPDGNPVSTRLEFRTFSDNGNTVVPEPFTMALGAAGIGLALRRRMKKAK